MNIIRPTVIAVLGSALVACSASNPPVANPETGAGAGTKAKGEAYDAVPLISRDVLFGNPDKASPQLSPDGKTLAYLAPKDGVLNVWLRPLGEASGASTDRPVTDERVRGIRSYYWAPDSQHILYVQDQGGDENYHVYAVPVAGGPAKDLTPHDKIRAMIVAVEPSSPHHILVGLNERDPRLHDVYRLDLRTGERVLVQVNDIGAIAWIADHELRVRAAQRPNPDGGSTLLVRAGDKDPWRDLVTWGPEDMFTSGPVAFTGDGRSLYILSSAGSDTAELRTIDVASGAEKTLASDPSADVASVLVHPTSHQIQAVSFLRARREWQALDPAVADHLGAAAALHAGDMQIDARDDADGTWLLSFVQDKGPVAYYTYDTGTKKGRFLFVHQPALADQPLAEMKPVRYRARDGLTIHGYLTTPVGVEPRGLPAVVLVHGGPWARDRWGYNGLVQLLANRGYAVLQPNFRGSTGYGKAFINAADREWGGKMQDDVTDGTRWLVREGVADAERICIMGGSYGGYATLMGLAKEPELYTCGVDIVGVANLVTWLKTIPPYWMPMQHLLFQRVGNPDTEADFLKSRSPVALADRIKAPLLIGQGVNDPRVPRDESVQIRDALQKGGQSVEYVEYADEGHGFARPENRLDFFARAERFLAEHLGGRHQP